MMRTGQSPALTLKKRRHSRSSKSSTKPSISTLCKSTRKMVNSPETFWRDRVISAMRAGQTSAILLKIYPHKDFTWDIKRTPPLKLLNGANKVHEWINKEELYCQFDLMKKDDDPNDLKCVIVSAMWPPGRSTSRGFQLETESLYEFWQKTIIPTINTLHNGTGRWRKVLKEGFVSCGQRSVVLMVMYKDVDYFIEEKENIKTIDSALVSFQGNEVVCYLSAQWKFLVNYVTKTEKCEWALGVDTDDIEKSTALYFIVLNPELKK